MAQNTATEDFAAELQSLRDVIPHAEKVGATQTSISVELLAALLRIHDSANVAEKS